MQETMRVVRAGLLCSGAVLGVLANTALAQESEPSAAADSPAVPQEVVITGSRIQRRDYSSESPIVTVTDAAGRTVGAFALTPGNRITLTAPGRYVVMLEARSGAGHWLCVLLSGRQWDARP